MPLAVERVRGARHEASRQPSGRRPFPRLRHTGAHLSSADLAFRVNRGAPEVNAGAGRLMETLR
jgi:hypothetical protein